MATPRINWPPGILMLLSAMLSGCTVYHVPNMAPTAMESKASLRVPSVALINGHSDDGVIEIGKAGAGTMVGDLRAWTRSAEPTGSNQQGQTRLKSNQ